MLSSYYYCDFVHVHNKKIYHQNKLSHDTHKVKESFGTTQSLVFHFESINNYSTTTVMES